LATEAELLEGFGREESQQFGRAGKEQHTADQQVKSSTSELAPVLGLSHGLFLSPLELLRHFS
jgi:hypothetical protein